MVSYFRGSQQYRALTVPELTQQMLKLKNMICAVGPRSRQIVNTLSYVPWQNEQRKVDERMINVQKTHHTSWNGYRTRQVKRL